MLPAPPDQLRAVAIIWSTYNDEITRPLLDGAVEEYRRRTGSDRGLVVIPASGSYELPQLASVAAATGAFDAVVALGCIIKGETSHDQHIASAVSHALMNVSTRFDISVGFGVLTVDTEAQGHARAGGAMGNKGVEAMAAAMETACTALALRAHAKRSGSAAR
ncbi:MAG: 6,7-dimethyl-8-ribityllumazine synthase [Planctomycetota bacterium]|nr:6,7-dimethyl-8-ribityllumazine synthase [Planctomycetota bacterium]